MRYLARAEGSDSASDRSRANTDRKRLASGQRVGLHRFARIAPVGGVAFQNFDMRSRLTRRGGSTIWATNQTGPEGLLVPNGYQAL